MSAENIDVIFSYVGEFINYMDTGRNITIHSCSKSKISIDPLFEVARQWLWDQFGKENPAVHVDTLYNIQENNNSDVAKSEMVMQPNDKYLIVGNMNLCGYFVEAREMTSDIGWISTAKKPRSLRTFVMLCNIESNMLSMASHEDITGLLREQITNLNIANSKLLVERERLRREVDDLKAQVAEFRRREASHNIYINNLQGELHEQISSKVTVRATPRSAERPATANEMFVKAGDDIRSYQKRKLVDELKMFKRASLKDTPVSRAKKYQ